MWSYWDLTKILIWDEAYQKSLNLTLPCACFVMQYCLTLIHSQQTWLLEYRYKEGRPMGLCLCLSRLEKALLSGFMI